MSSTSDIIGITAKLVDFVHKLAGPYAEQRGFILGDNEKFVRLKNWIRVTTEAHKLLSEAQLPPNAIPPRLFIPIRDASSLEDDETLQSLWAGLLATASQQTDLISPSYVETLKQLTPDEARYLQHVYKDIHGQNKRRLQTRSAETTFAFIKRGSAAGMSPDTFERLGLIRREWGMTRDKDVGHSFVFTGYAVEFLKACNGPRAASDQDDANMIKEFAKEIRRQRSPDQERNFT